MIIRKIEEKDIQDVITYNINTYSERDQVEESFKYRFDNNPFNMDATNESLMVLNANNKIIGQALMMPSMLSYKGKLVSVRWGMDFFMDKSYRGLTGTLMLKRAIEVGDHFGVGLSKTALELHLYFGEHIAGYLSKYLRLTSIVGLLKSLFNRHKLDVKSYQFPESLRMRGGKFIRVRKPEEIGTGEGYWNPDLAEFIRNEAFLKWRFFEYKDKYTVYKYQPDVPAENPESVYFVVRPIVWRKLNCLLLCDYRFTSGKKEMFEKILKAAAKIAREKKIAATFTGCSLPGLDKILRKKYFLRLGQKMVIITNYRNLKSSRDLQKDTILVTFADSDIDFYFFSDKW